MTILVLKLRKDAYISVRNLFLGGKKMAMIEETKSITNVIQNIILENREKLNVSGVLDVLSFDDQIVIVETELGLLTIKGENLKINKLNIDTSEITLDGSISSLSYSNSDSLKKNTSRIHWKNFQIKVI